MTESTKRPHPLVRVADRGAEETGTHPLNPDAEIHGYSLSNTAGLERVGLHFIRIPPGKVANIHHTHTFEEEFYYILSGCGVIEIDDDEHDVGPGDFIGFATPSAGHLLRNASSNEDLVYLVGGERRGFELATYPKIGKHLIRTGGTGYLVDSEHLEEAWSRE